MLFLKRDPFFDPIPTGYSTKSVKLVGDYIMSYKEVLGIPDDNVRMSIIPSLGS